MKHQGCTHLLRKWKHQNQFPDFLLVEFYMLRQKRSKNHGMDYWSMQCNKFNGCVLYSSLVQFPGKLLPACVWHIVDEKWGSGCHCSRQRHIGGSSANTCHTNPKSMQTAGLGQYGQGTLRGRNGSYTIGTKTLHYTLTHWGTGYSVPTRIGRELPLVIAVFCSTYQTVISISECIKNEWSFNYTKLI